MSGNFVWQNIDSDRNFLWQNCGLGNRQGAQTEVYATKSGLAGRSRAEKIIGSFDEAVCAIANGCVLP